MTIRERFAKYSVEEIEAGIVILERKLAESNKLLKEFKEERNLEMFKSESKTNEDLFMKLLDAQSALSGRI